MRANPEFFKWRIHRVLYFRSHEYSIGFRVGMLSTIEALIEYGVIDE